MRHSTRSNLCAGTLRTITEASIHHASLTHDIPVMAPSTHSPHTPLINLANNPTSGPNPKPSDSSSEHNYNKTLPVRGLPVYLFIPFSFYYLSLIPLFLFNSLFLLLLYLLFYLPPSSSYCSPLLLSPFPLCDMFLTSQ